MELLGLEVRQRLAAVKVSRRDDPDLPPPRSTKILDANFGRGFSGRPGLLPVGSDWSFGKERRVFRGESGCRGSDSMVPARMSSSLCGVTLVCKSVLYETSARGVAVVGMGEGGLCSCGLQAVRPRAWISRKHWMRPRAAGVMPVMRLAWPRVEGRTRLRRSTISRERPLTRV